MLDVASRVVPPTPFNSTAKPELLLVATVKSIELTPKLPVDFGTTSTSTRAPKLTEITGFNITRALVVPVSVTSPSADAFPAMGHSNITVSNPRTPKHDANPKDLRLVILFSFMWFYSFYDLIL